MHEGFEPVEVLRLLRENHLRGLTEDENRVLAASATGASRDEIAARLFRSSRTVRAAMEKLADLAGQPAGIEHRSPVALGFWFAFHLECERDCLKLAREMIANNTIFPSAPTGGEPPKRLPERPPKTTPKRRP